MTQEEKLLLTKDLCARLPYGVKCYVPVENCTMELTGKRLNYFCFHKDVWGIDYCHEFEIVIDPLNDAHNGYIIKPYLRPMSSMTDEEINEFILISDTVLWLGDKRSSCILSLEQMDWLNKRHFDYRGLIEKGLAIAVTEENNPYKN